MMKKLAFLLLILITHLFYAQNDTEAAKALLMRIAPTYKDKIVFKKEVSSGKDFYQLEYKKDHLIITANSANSMAVGLNFFLTTYCKTSVSWYADNRIEVPATFPKLSETVKNESRVNNRFFLNYCTFGYTMPWWKWKDWERFIDWMALNGVNLPLAITGQEKIWLNVWKKFGFSENEIRNYFTGPAYLPWHRMANIDHWEGPLPMSWIDGQAELQQKILKRERELNMKPVLPAFAGHVPKILKDKFPNAKITSLGEWGDFDRKYESYFLDSFDPLFEKIQKEFLKEQTKLFGTDHIYGTDPFNEVTPPSWEPQDLASVSKHIYKSMAKVDEKAQWLQMGWIFYFQKDKWTNDRIKAFLQAVPQDKMILLDYYCDKTEIWKTTDSFFGQPYIWCYLGNFGGNTSIKGNLDEIDKRIENTYTNGGKNLWGLGATLEGFGNNPMMYEFVLNKAWTHSKSKEDFISHYALARSGSTDAKISEAWKILSEKIYTESADLGNADLTNSKPVFEKAGSWTTNFTINYSNKDLLQAWKLLIDSKSDTDNYKDDLAVVGKQVLGNYFPVLRDTFTQAYRQKDITGMKNSGKKMLDLINDIDLLLSANKNFLVGKWINDAKAMTDIPGEKAYYERDARKIITVWGEKGKGLNDYGNRSIAGLMKDYYGARWRIFIDASIKSAEQGIPVDEKEILKKVDDFSWEWSEKQNTYSENPTGDAKQINKLLYQKYASLILNTK
ncbi:alpha-N-acetylglucosaminidase [Chryseobacterium taeanense]|uniref:Alpha-N-acetylglucosaminidase n=1 Tax=Chryseobacterium taeanense TaxID=311334 RepID=A0A1G8KHD6_9FLAO|nr:alpha-N-acetylglucosaminidase [Chryseobacterium taeanense]SDI42290.1 alpha-N-acetylglucosaminidase [Chryseobacterium taeanense]